ncbi:MAG: peptide deformylase [Firmicutes bacterium]|uniref:Peptide deformylase n=1 Tax=Sulfobacillus benefaciens TaxID=453960 RepID=A0A2T2XAB2_9FIRM|nr:peptide deformylase [Bacillota bacterium]MCL5015566.1 peptide deformylase [Bacillota bacterium]PSR31425.1 MAG: peptide deformylase [Sulfobacillus benefaciens]HBQ95508.1 peptide deformylase [Sulfobacillus sp.]
MKQAIWSISTQNDFLRTRTTRIKTFSTDIQRLFTDLFDTWPTVAAYGIAAPQIGSPKRLFIWKGTKMETPEIIVNPKIIRARGEVKDYDGCLSVPGIYGPTRRAEYIELSGTDTQGRPWRRGFEGFDARIIQHEVDHLEGVLFIDRIDTLDELYTMEEISKDTEDEDEDPEYQKTPLTEDLRRFIEMRRRPLPGYALIW